MQGNPPGPEGGARRAARRGRRRGVATALCLSLLAGAQAKAQDAPPSEAEGAEVRPREDVLGGRPDDDATPPSEEAGPGDVGPEDDDFELEDGDFELEDDGFELEGDGDGAAPTEGGARDDDAGERRANVRELEEMYVPGGREGGEPGDAVTDREVITRRDIEESGAENVTEALEEHPSVDVRPGFRGGRIQIQGLIDGERLI